MLARAILYRPLKLFAAMPSEATYGAAQSLVFHECLLGELPAVDPWTVEQLLLSIKQARRRKALKRAQEKRQLRGCNHRDYYRVNPFGKVEKLDGFIARDGCPAERGKTYVPRLIQATHDETHLDTGIWFKPLIHELKSVWHKDNWIFYGSVTPDELDYWINKHSGSRTFFWSDYSAYDCTWSEPAFELIEGVYRRCFPDAPPEFWKLLKMLRKPVSKIKFVKDGDLEIWLKYWSDFGLASGRDDTALANALLNGLVLALSFAAALAGVSVVELRPIHLYRARQAVSISIVGDDSLVCCDFDVGPYVEVVTGNIESFGLSVKSNWSEHLCDVTFLGAMPYLVNNRYWWGPTIGRRVYRAFWQTEPKGNLPAWTKGVARQLATYSHVPILSDMAKRILKLLEGYKETGDPWTYDESVFSCKVTGRPDYDQSTLRWLCERYRSSGLVESHIRQDLLTIGQIQRLPAVVELPACELMVLADDL